MRIRKEIPKQIVEIPEFDSAIAIEGWTKLVIETPHYAKSVEDAVNAGRTPDEIFRYILQRTGRMQLARRCRAAASYLVTQKENG